MSFYPEKVQRRSISPAAMGTIPDANANATGASFVCGAFIKLAVHVDDESAIATARFSTNGCGFMTAAADVVCGWLEGRELRELHGLNAAELDNIVQSNLGIHPGDRDQCVAVVFEAVRAAMAGFRRDRIEEFRGEKALICTCFGIDEEAITDLIKENQATDVGDVIRYTKAGSGCGSCLMLIEEIIDSSEASDLNAEWGTRNAE